MTTVVEARSSDEEAPINHCSSFHTYSSWPRGRKTCSWYRQFADELINHISDKLECASGIMLPWSGPYLTLARGTVSSRVESGASPFGWLVTTSWISVPLMIPLIFVLPRIYPKNGTRSPTRAPNLPVCFILSATPCIFEGPGDSIHRYDDSNEDLHSAPFLPIEISS
ncbi:hypothetical protein F5148DRAFT_1161330 [Russula earlei]|uniref:Uncharacterized protein n=1 Tax=Russula earlei TaxID=71964 RepID=A0ACC0UNF8_9AGAM|nr:hypothetical protein F5148DRAFT_1161330 [Russula earlei]